jgi:hypothetical protein
MVYWRQGNDYNRATWDDLSQNADRISNPWANGRYALSAIVWGLILMFTFSVGVGS